jgi:predicted alpha/beta superfamily hydrolase
MTTKPATILASEVRMMKSKHTGRKYRITISLPYAYTKPLIKGWPFDDAPDKWPVVYLIDANWHFGMVTDLIRSMAWWRSTTDAIVVGIGYPEDEDPQEAWREAFARRNTDLSPVRSEATGDAANFHKFIKDELIPVVEQEYRADPSRRILVGHSSGGDFAAFALFQEPDLFDTFIIGSPSLCDYDRFIFKDEEAYAKEHKKLPARVYLYVGDLEERADITTLTDILRFATLLVSRNYEGLSLVKQVFMDLNHSEVVAPGFQAGLKMALKKSGH